MDMQPVRHEHLLRFQPGDRRGRLTIKGVAGTKHFGRGVAVVFACQCDCGATLTRDRQTLVKDADHACDKCRRGAKSSAPRGATSQAEHKVWWQMIDRCTNPRNKSFPNYGGRGIAVCERWMAGDQTLTGYECFLADMGRRPSPDLTIERSNTDGGYAPGNCSWANRTVQSRNRRGLRLVTINGRTQPASVWAEESGVPYFTLIRRLERGMAPERAIIPGDYRRT